MAKLKPLAVIDGDEYFTTPESGTVVNMSELLRIYKAVGDAVKPGMSEAEIDAIIKTTVKRMNHN